MLERADEFRVLVIKYMKEEISPDEQARLEELTGESQYFKDSFEKLTQQSSLQHAYRELLRFKQEWDSLPGSPAFPVESIGSTHRIHFLKTTWFRYAAAVILLFGVAAAIFVSADRQSRQQKLVSGNKRLQTDVAPGGDRAILTLANGQRIILDSTLGDIVKQGGLTVVNLAGKVKYVGVGTNAEYNTISTPKGGQYQVVLPDGSKVWLNAASSIKFPTAFTRNERNVEVTGEAYMEVARNPKQSFVVKANGTEIQVLGTSFNVNAYRDETAVKTTLISGSVKVISGANSLVSDKSNQTSSSVVVLKPGQQAVVESSDGQHSLKNIDIKIQPADFEQTLAWKNGIFNFQNKKLDEVMRQLSRWYDIEVVYQKNIPSIEFAGEMSRNMTLSNTLKALQQSEVHFIMEGRRLTILP